VPFLATLQSGVFYPPSALLLLPFPLGFDLFLLCHFWIAALGMAAFLRRRGNLPLAAALGAVTFTLGGTVVSFANLLNQLQSAAWSPWVLWASEGLAERQTPRRVVALAVSASLLFLGGSPEIAALTVLLAFFRLYGSRRRASLRASLVFSAGVIAGAGLAAIQLVPTIEYFRYSSRWQPLGPKMAAVWSMEPVSLLQLLFPHSANPWISGAADPLRTVFESHLPWLHSIYLGIVPLCLAFAGATFGRERLFLGSVLFVGVFLALGSHGPLFPALLHLASPLAGRLRYPAKFFFLAHVSASVLAADGAEALLSRSIRAAGCALAAGATFAAIGATCLGLRWLAPAGFLSVVATLKAVPLSADELASLGLDVAAKSERLLLVLAGFFALLLGRRLGTIGERAFAFLLVGLAAADLAAVHRGLNGSISWQELRREPPLLEPPASEARWPQVFHYQTSTIEPPGVPPRPIPGLEAWFSSIQEPTLEENARWLWRIGHPNLGALQGLRHFGGVEGLEPASDRLLRSVLSILPRDRAVRLLRIYGVGFLVGPNALEAPGIEPLPDARSLGIRAYRIVDPMPLAFAVERLVEAPTERDGFNVLIRLDFDPRREAVVERLPPGWENPPSPSTGAPEVELLSYAPERVGLRVRSPRRVLLVLNEAFFPGWQAKVDGKPEAILEANVVVRGVVIPPGEHTVEFVYCPASLRLGGIASLATAALLAFGWALERRTDAR
jgi:hypothetical protein